MTLTERFKAASALPLPTFAASLTRLPVSTSGRWRGKAEARLLNEALFKVDEVDDCCVNASGSYIGTVNHGGGGGQDRRRRAFLV